MKYDVRYKTVLRHHWLEKKFNFFLNVATLYRIQKIILYYKTIPNLKIYQKNNLETNVTFSKSLELEIS